MKQELLQIIEWEMGETKLKAPLMAYFESVIDDYEAQRPTTVQKFRQLLGKYNFHTIEAFSEYEDYPQVTLFKGIDEYTFWPVIDYMGGVSDRDEEIGTMVRQADVPMTGMPEGGEEEDEWYKHVWDFHHKIIFTWLVTVWQEVNGWKAGIVVKTLENNSVSQFFFNDLSWDDLSLYMHFEDKSKFIKQYFKTELTIYEIYQRVANSVYPFNPYKNDWTRFSNGSHIVEIVAYANATGERKYKAGLSKPSLKIKKHKDYLERVKYVRNKGKAWIESGFREQFIHEAIAEKIYPEAIEIGLHSAVGWHRDEVESRVPIKQIESLEKHFNIQLPFHYKHYLQLLNGRKFNRYRMNFHVGNNEYLKVATFHDFDEINTFLASKIDVPERSFMDKLLNKSNTEGLQKVEWLEIGVINENEKLMLNMNPNSDNYSNLGAMANGAVRDLGVAFEDFIQETKF